MRNETHSVKHGKPGSRNTGTAPSSPYTPGRSRHPFRWFVLLVVSVLSVGAVLFSQNDALREQATSFVEREPGETIFPLPARYSNSFANDWGASREQGRHEGTDIYAPEGTPVYSVTSGTVTTSYGSSEDGWNTLGGYTVMVVADRDSGIVTRGDRLYYAHLSEPTPLEDGTRIGAGDRIGTVGNTAGEIPGTVADFPPHLHLGWYGGFGGMFGGERERAASSSGAINPYPLLRNITTE